MNKLYRDTVTLYHADAAAQTVVRTVLRPVFLQKQLFIKFKAIEVTHRNILY